MKVENLPDNVSGVAFQGEDPVFNDCKHQWEKVATTERKERLTFWVCLRCGKVSPGPTDNEHLDPTQPRRSRPFCLNCGGAHHKHECPEAQIITEEQAAVGLERAFKKEG